MRELDDDEMVDQLRTHLLRADSPTPSIEALVHAFLPAAYVDHTHADAILALTNRNDGLAIVKEALGPDVIVLPYVTPGFKLALAAARALDDHPDAWGMVWAHHGIVTWGDTAQASYETMIRLVTRAEQYVAANRAKPGASPTVGRPLVAVQSRTEEMSDARLAQVAPVVRGLLAERTGDCDRPYRQVVLRPLTGPEVLAVLASPGAREAFVNPALTTDHLIRTKALPLLVEGVDFDDPAALRARLESAVQTYCEDYQAYVEQHRADMPTGMEPFAPQPRVVLIPGLGVLCAGPDLHDAEHRAGHHRAHACGQGLDHGGWGPLPRAAGGRALPHGVPDAPARSSRGRPGARAGAASAAGGAARHCAGTWRW